jgi:hypothetical protein
MAVGHGGVGQQTELPTRGFSSNRAKGKLRSQVRRFGPFAHGIATRVPQDLVPVVMPRTARRRGQALH